MLEPASRGAIVLACLAILAPACGGDDSTPRTTARATTDVGGLVAEGKAAYEETCAACHGVDLKGTDSGPPFLDAIYEPGHHPDEAFFAAVANGVQPHHWDFGPMPPQPDVTADEVEAIVAYVRAQQREAGIIE